jgi:pyrroline-5-carboxylate reductase
MNKQKIGIIGYGGMGSALAKGLAKAGADIFVIARENADKARAELGNMSVYKTIADAGVEFSDTDFIIPAVKPQHMIACCAELKPHIRPKYGTMIVSPAAGVTVDFYKYALDLQAARAMPNTPCLLGCGMSTVYIPAHVPADKAQMIMAIFENPYMGKAQRVDREKMIDAGTAISGSGPAYGYVLARYIAEKTGMLQKDVIKDLACLVKKTPAEWENSSLAAGLLLFTFRAHMISGAQALGFDGKNAVLQVDQTIRGSIAMLNDLDSPDIPTLIENVKSSKGTTEAALNVMLAPGTDFLDQIVPGIRAAFARGQEMGGETLHELESIVGGV